MKTILVTGGAGFIGSNYLNYAVRKYPRYRFINVDVLTYAGRLANIEISRAKNYSFVKADIRNLAAMDSRNIIRHTSSISLQRAMSM